MVQPNNVRDACSIILSSGWHMFWMGTVIGPLDARKTSPAFLLGFPLGGRLPCGRAWLGLYIAGFLLLREFAQNIMDIEWECCSALKSFAVAWMGMEDSYTQGIQGHGSPGGKCVVPGNIRCTSTTERHWKFWEGGRRGMKLNWNFQEWMRGFKVK